MVDYAILFSFHGQWNLDHIIPPISAALYVEGPGIEAGGGYLFIYL